MVRVVGENIENPGVFPVKEAVQMAHDLELDLVEISPNADPPVCRIVDYQKFLYQQKKKQKELKAKASKIVVKEIRFGPNTDEHGINTAAATFFGKTPATLRQEECALLVGLLKAPSYYSPLRHPQKALERRNIVLDQLEKYGYISRMVHDSLVNIPIKLNFNDSENMHSR